VSHDRGPKAWRFLAAPLAWTLLIAFLATRPPGSFALDVVRSAGVPTGVLGHVYHGGAFFVLAILLGDGLERARVANRPGGRALLALLGAVVVSVGVELIQFATPPRSPQISDIAVNLVGATLGVGLMATRTWWPRLGTRPLTAGLPVSDPRRRS
jgi:hypothetical protein